MTNLLIEYKELTIPLYSALMLGVGYLLKESYEHKKNKNKALFLLLEVWYRTASLSLINTEYIMSVFFNKLEEKFNIVSLSIEEKKVITSTIVPVINNSLESSINIDTADYKKKFKDAITLIALSDPVFAYKMNTIDNVNTLTNYLDSCENELNNEGEKDPILTDIKEMFTDKAKSNSIDELEKNIKTLALKISFITRIKVNRLIKERKKNLKTIDSEELDEFVENFYSAILNHEKELNKG